MAPVSHNCPLLMTCPFLSLCHLCYLPKLCATQCWGIEKKVTLKVRTLIAWDAEHGIRCFQIPHWTPILSFGPWGTLSYLLRSSKGRGESLPLTKGKPRYPWALLLYVETKEFQAGCLGALSPQHSRPEDSMNLFCQILKNGWTSQGMINFMYELCTFKSSSIIMSLLKNIRQLYIIPFKQNVKNVM